MSSAGLGYTPKGLYIGGEWTPGVAGETRLTLNPANGERLAEVPWAGEEDVDLAVKAAKRAAPDWARTPPGERARCLEALAESILANAEELALIDVYDSGNTLSGMRGDMTWSADTLRYFAGLVRELKGTTFINGPDHLNMTLRQPYGVVAKIGAFNHPFRFCAEKVAAPLAAGNCVVVKQPEQTPLGGLRFAELCDGIFPPGVVNVVTGDAIAGSALVRHADVSRIAFIGSVETGRIIAREAAEGIKEVTLELGGKNPIIIFADADATKAASLVLKGMNLNRQGQSCSSTSRVFVHESLHDEVIERLVEGARKYRVGLPWEEDTDVGPVVSEDQYDRVMGFIGSAKAEGAKLLTGGGRPDGEKLGRGFFIAPTVFDAVTPEMRIAREEIFGPVMSVLTWRDYEQMMETVNGLMYGLTAAIVTNDLKLAMRTADRIQAGYVWINSSGRYLGAPYGGWKQSGLGREESLDELLSYTQIKNINLAW
ncbi:MAG: aldehyde dehydrogenase family protein [Proteobacteria bacterium]|nr:aldehyde dehydrogenase family protein [Pseudomonadota bacterium]